MIAPPDFFWDSCMEINRFGEETAWNGRFWIIRVLDGPVASCPSEATEGVDRGLIPLGRRGFQTQTERALP
jgi:hypothetical protein